MKSGFNLLFVAFLATLLFSGCKKDDEESTSGYFSINGTKHELAKCYISKRINNDAGHENEDNYDLVFASESITLTNIEGEPEGSGNMFAVVLTTSSTSEGIESGEYIFGIDESIPFSYSGTIYFVGYNSFTQTIQKTGETGADASIVVIKSGNSYQFSLEGETEDGETFNFSYIGNITVLVPHEV